MNVVVPLAAAAVAVILHLDRNQLVRCDKLPELS
jgi:hypothetical protein